MKCKVCPAYCTDSVEVGCLVLNHSGDQPYKGCTYRDERIRRELKEWLNTTPKEVVSKYRFNTRNI